MWIQTFETSDYLTEFQWNKVVSLWNIWVDIFKKCRNFRGQKFLKFFTSRTWDIWIRFYDRRWKCKRLAKHLS